MAGFTVDQPQQFQAQAPGTAMVGPNTRLKSQSGFLGTQADTLMFSDGAVGSWTVPNTRVRSLGVFLISQSSQGIATVPTPSPPHPAPILVVNGNPKLKTM
jgi:hypothetical protein